MNQEFLDNTNMYLKSNKKNLHKKKKIVLSLFVLIEGS